LLQLPGHHAAAVAVDPDGEMPPVGCCADVGDVAEPAASGWGGPSMDSLVVMA
jgi:hypothetical protein